MLTAWADTECTLAFYGCGHCAYITSQYQQYLQSQLFGITS